MISTDKKIFVVTLDCSVVMKFLSNLGKGTDITKSEKEPERKSGYTQLPCLDKNNSAAVSK